MTSDMNWESVLEEAPEKSVVLDKHEDAGQKLGGLWHFPETAPMTSAKVAKGAPLVVLHRGRAS